jgi:hypothetical protein
MRFTKSQVALFRCGISFAHMAPTTDRRDIAKRDFLEELLRVGMYYTLGINTVYRGDNSAKAMFRHASPAGESSDHVAVMFMDGKKDEFSSEKIYNECKYIPAEIDGVGPMVVK